MIQLIPRTFATQPVQTVRIGRPFLGVLFVLEALVLLAIVAFAIRAIPRVDALSSRSDYDTVRSAIYARTTGTVVDPLIDTGSGERAPASNIRGFSLNGQVYYYYFEGQQNYDPYSRGQVSSNQIRPVLHDQGDQSSLVIYTIDR